MSARRAAVGDRYLQRSAFHAAIFTSGPRTRGEGGSRYSIRCRQGRAAASRSCSSFRRGAMSASSRRSLSGVGSNGVRRTAATPKSFFERRGTRSREAVPSFAFVGLFLQHFRNELLDKIAFVRTRQPPTPILLALLLWNERIFARNVSPCQITADGGVQLFLHISIDQIRDEEHRRRFVRRICRNTEAIAPARHAEGRNIEFGAL